MAKQKGIIKLRGTIGDISFYKSQDGHLAREKSSIDKGRIANDPAFIRTRENNDEFSESARSGKLMRNAFRSLMMSASDGRVSSRLTKVMNDIKNLDVTSARGKRTVLLGSAGAEGKALLKGFDFNKRSILGSVLVKPYTINPGTGEIDIMGLTAVNDIVYPAGATHFSLKAAFATINFETKEYDVQLSNVVNLPVGGPITDVALIPTAVPAGTGVKFNLLMIEFFQEVNAVQYSLKNGAYNALAIVAVN